MRVFLYLKGIIGDKNAELSGQDPAMSMLAKRKKTTLNADEKDACTEL